MATRPKTETSAVAEWAALFLVYLFGTTTLLQGFVVPTASMDPTVKVGDHLFVDKLTYAPAQGPTSRLLPYSDVKRGDIVVFRYPLDIKQNYVKRVIGVPGDRIHFQDKRLWLNGRVVNEPYIQLDPRQRSRYLNDFPALPLDVPIEPRAVDMLRGHVSGGELVVPEGQYFVLGDNRDDSADSRWWGFVPHDNIVGKPLIVYWSYDAPTERLSNGNIDPEHIVDIALHFFTKTRWDRTFRLVRGYDLR